MVPPNDRERRPSPKGGAPHKLAATTATSSPPSLTERAAFGRRADLALHCAWLRGNAHLLFDIDITIHIGGYGDVAANLLDHADLLEVAEANGWWDR
jgi:hypothetical protein